MRRPRRPVLSNSSLTRTMPDLTALLGQRSLSPGLLAQLLTLEQILVHVSVSEHREMSSQAINSRLEQEHREKNLDDDWKWAAMVVDRLCLFIFSTFISFATAALFASVPYILQTL